MSSDERRGIVVGIDGSEACRRALDWAKARTDRFGPIRPVHSWEYPTTVTAATPFGPGPIPTTIEMERSAEAITAECTAELGDAPSLDPIITRGEAGQVLVEAAADAELLVVGSRGRSAMRANLLGSVGRHCADHTPIPLVIVPHHDDDPVPPADERIVVGVDGTEHSARALRWALRTADPAAQIIAVTAWQTPVDAPFLFRETRFDLQELRRSAHDLVTGAVAAACAETGVDPARVRTEVSEGDPRQVLHRAAEEADLLVLGQRGRSGLPHLVLGSTTTSLVHRPTCPVAVIPHPEG